ncbi:hypothetical protein [Idiomarina sp. HP20-50]|uniref:hypothetical protein n=1 Tax=Idiomarina sp. HP20-50 TaxID=3070813 RepID=UPI00294ABFCB|nr:hypothetical protein [Idiomarina sp. HP20-50]MDV6317216.1 hypothetical protein [Idiomarina sp. HP20-50]
MSRTNFEKQVAYIIAMIEMKEKDSIHQRVSRHLGHDSYVAEHVFAALYPLLGNGRTMEQFRNSIRGQLNGVRKAINGTEKWSQPGIDSLGPLYGADLDTLEHQFKSIAEVV